MKFILRKILAWFDSFLDRIVSVIGAIVFSQIPQFISQYIDVLSGALAESKRQVALIQQQAILLNLTIDEFVQRHVENSDPVFQGSGRIFQETLSRFEFLNSAYHSLIESSVWAKPFLFLSHYDSDLVSALRFRPALPLTWEGAVYAVLGMLLALILYHYILKLPMRVIKMLKAKKDGFSTAD